MSTRELEMEVREGGGGCKKPGERADRWGGRGGKEPTPSSALGRAPTQTHLSWHPGCSLCSEASGSLL